MNIKSQLDGGTGIKLGTFSVYFSFPPSTKICKLSINSKVVCSLNFSKRSKKSTISQNKRLLSGSHNIKSRLHILAKRKMAGENGRGPADTRAELAELLKHKEELAV